MAKSCLSLAAMTCALVLVVGCGGKESMASRSARAFREAQQRGERVGGEAHVHEASAGEAPAHGHKASAGEAAHEHGDAAAEAHAGPSAGEHEAVTHGASEHGDAAAAHAATRGHAATAAQSEHPGRLVERAAPGSATVALSARGGATTRSTAAHSPQAAALPAPVDHAAMGHAASPAAAHPPPGTPPQPVHAAAAPPTVPGAPAATLVPDAIDAAAPTAVADAHLAAAANAGEHGGHAAHGAGNYRQIDAGRTAEPQPTPSHHEPNGQDPGRAAHDGHGAHAHDADGHSGGDDVRGHAQTHDAGGHAHSYGADGDAGGHAVEGHAHRSDHATDSTENEP
jgi:hypothetical protein